MPTASVKTVCPTDAVFSLQLSKFLQKQQKTGIIQVKELSKGVDSLTDLDKSHELYVHGVPLSLCYAHFVTANVLYVYLLPKNCSSLKMEAFSINLSLFLYYGPVSTQSCTRSG